MTLEDAKQLIGQSCELDERPGRIVGVTDRPPGQDGRGVWLLIDCGGDSTWRRVS